MRINELQKYLEDLDPDLEVMGVDSVGETRPLLFWVVTEENRETETQELGLFISVD